jgi:hypothetical protein
MSIKPQKSELSNYDDTADLDEHESVQSLIEGRLNEAMEPFTRNGFKIISAFDSEDETTKLSLLVLPEDLNINEAYDVLLDKSLASISFKAFSEQNNTVSFEEELVTVMTDPGRTMGAFEDSYEAEHDEIHRGDYSAHIRLATDHDTFQGNGSFNKLLVTLSNLASSENAMFFGYSEDQSDEFEHNFDYGDSTLYSNLETIQDKIAIYAERFEKKNDSEIELTA